MISVLPDHIKLQVVADGVPVERIMCMFSSATNYKNEFTLVIGPSDSNGHIIVTKSEILARAKEDAQLFVMDYGNPSECIIGVFSVVPMNLCH